MNHDIYANPNMNDKILINTLICPKLQDDWKTKSTTTEMYNNKKINFKTFEKIVNINIIEVRGIRKNNLPMFIEHNNTLMTDPNRIANTFDNYFANIGSDIASNICADENNEMYKQYLLTQSQCSCKFEKIHEDDILKIINKMDNKRSSGYDMFSNKVIKAIKK